MITQEQENQIASLYAEMYPMMMTYARTLLNDKNDSRAEDCVHHAFQIACEKPDTLLSSANPKGWLIITLKNTILNEKRARQKLRKQLTDYLMLHNPVHIDKEIGFIELKEQCQSTLKEDDLNLLIHIVIDGWTIKETADSMGISQAACAKRAQRAKRQLREVLEKNK